jgi:hypothetical protein
MTSRRFLLTAAAAIVFVAGSTAAGASASPRQGGAGIYGVAGANATSQYFAGYQANATAAPISTSGKFRLPPLSCATSAHNLSSPDIIINLPVGLLMGSFLSTSTSLESDTDWGFAAVFENCKGAPYYVTFLCLGWNTQYPNCQTTFNPNSGDLMKVTISASPTASNASVTDVTRAESSSLSGPGASNLRLVGVGVAPFIHTVPVFNFGKLRIFHATMDGVTPKAAGAIAVNENSAGILQVRTSALNTAGNAWTEVWKHS